MWPEILLFNAGGFLILEEGEPVLSLPSSFLFMTLIDRYSIDPVLKTSSIFQLPDMIISGYESPLGNFHSDIMISKIFKCNIIYPFKPQTNQFAKRMIISFLRSFNQTYTMLDCNVP